MLIADSGGSGTEWCFVDHVGNRSYFSGRSYHPIYWNDQFIREEKQFWERRKNLLQVPLVFFGAGCLNEINAEKMKELFIGFGFASVQIHSDLHAAAYSLLGNQSGSFGILGTGSVAAQIKDGNVYNVIGGLGYLLGDEGSGFYFGKILVRKLLSGELSVDLSKTLHERFGNKSELLKQIYSSDSRSFLSGLSKATADIDHPEIQKIHEENLDLFFQSLKGKLDSTDSISLVGSYAWYHRELVQKCALKYAFDVPLILEKPIERLSEYLSKPTK